MDFDFGLLTNVYVMVGGALSLGLLMGVLGRFILVRYIHNLAKKTTWQSDDVLVSILNKISLFWGLLFGVWMVGQMPSILLPYQRYFTTGTLVLFIVSVTWAIGAFADALTSEFIQRNRSLPASSMVSVVAKGLIFVLGGLIILQMLGISITPLLTALGVGGLAVALALQPTLENLFSGLQILFSGKVRPGDYIEIDGGYAGYIEDINWRNTTIQALSNNRIIIPNKQVSSAVVTNYHQPDQEMSVLVDLGVAYDSDLEKVEKVTVDTAKKVMTELDGAVKEFEPFIRYNQFAESSINFTVILRVNQFVNQYLLKHEFIKALHKRYAKEGIEIPFPVRTVHLHKPKKS